MIGRVIFDQFGITGNYALASALSFSADRRCQRIHRRHPDVHLGAQTRRTPARFRRNDGPFSTAQSDVAGVD